MSIATAESSQTRAEARVSTFAVLIGIVLFAFAIRIAWLMWHGPSEITWDGAEYARIAANLIAGHGYVGLRGTTMFVFPPLYPLAILALLPLGGDVAQAGLDVSLLSGAVLIFPVYGMAATAYGRKAGYAAAVIVAVLPFTVQLSTVVLADMLFLTLAATGTHFLLRVENERRVADAIACSVAFALAYLTRPEGLLLWALALGIVLLQSVPRADRRHGVAVMLALLLPFFVLASPYVVFLTSHSNHVRVEGKSLLNLDIGLRMNRGMSYTVAADGIDRNLNQTGPELDQAYYFEPPGRSQPALGAIAAFGLQNLVRHVREIVHVIISPLCGTAVFCLLAVFGFLAGPWSRRRVWNQAILVAYGTVIAIALASVFHFWDRYFVGFIPLLIVWAANGIAVLEDAIAARFRVRRLGFAPLALAGIFLIALLFSNKVRFVDDSQSLVERTAGQWLAQNGGAGSRILSISDQSVFYAGGTWWMLPYAPDDGTALRYVNKIDPDYVVLDSDYAAERPYVTKWLAAGIPDRRARVVYTHGDVGGPTVAIVRWAPQVSGTAAGVR
jgi:4-amino-4-deoxy-L-arabinose transferase-like glycosyltransferase